MLKSAKNRFLALVGGKIGSNEKTLEIKCFSIISVNLNLKLQVQNQDFAFYHPRLLNETFWIPTDPLVWLSFVKLSIEDFLQSSWIQLEDSERYLKETYWYQQINWYGIFQTSWSPCKFNRVPNGNVFLINR